MLDGTKKMRDTTYTQTHTESCIDYMIDHNDKGNESTAQERQWALAIKAAAIEDEDINAQVMTDLEFLQFAIVCQGRVKEALVRIKRLQACKQLNGIVADGCYEQAIRDVVVFQRHHPHFILSLGALEDDTHVLSANWACFRAYRMKTPESHALRIRGLFYYFQGMRIMYCAPGARVYYMRLDSFSRRTHPLTFLVSILDVQLANPTLKPCARDM